MRVINQHFGDKWAMYHGDCVEVIKGIDDGWIDYSIFSPPFASLFTYSDSDRDMGNSKSDAEFMAHFNFLIPELFRVLKRGRLVSIHCMNLPTTIGREGYIGLKDFRGDIIRAFQNSGFIFHSEVCIWKDPLVQAVRTKNLTLAHKQISKDSTRCAMGFPDYIVTMRVPGENMEPVYHGRGFERYYGAMGDPKAPKTDNPRTNKYSHQVWQRYASPVWFDINQTNTLNVKMARDNNDERHICPLQLDTIARCLELWSNENDIVFSPFAGIGSEGYQSVLMNRRFLGVELKESYFKCAVSNLESVEKRQEQIRLFA